MWLSLVAFPISRKIAATEAGAHTTFLINGIYRFRSIRMSRNSQQIAFATELKTLQELFSVWSVMLQVM